MTRTATLVLHNARVITMDRRQPRAQAVAVQGERILAVGSDAEIRRQARSPNAEVIDCRGQALLPGFIDAHCHVLAYAASLLSLDCSPDAVSSIVDIQAALRRQAEVTPAGRWIRAVGYSEVDLAEGRHPTRWDLALAAPAHIERCFNTLDRFFGLFGVRRLKVNHQRRTRLTGNLLEALHAAAGKTNLVFAIALPDLDIQHQRRPKLDKGSRPLKVARPLRALALAVPALSL